MTTDAIVVRGLAHVYPTRRPRRRRSGRDAAHLRPADPALVGVDLDVPAGGVFGVLGPNGSGKTTLFRILATILRPTGGGARVFGHDLVADSQRVRRCLGVMFQMPSIDGKLTAEENLACHGRLYGMPRSAIRRRSDGLLDELGLAARRAEPAERFSGGMQRRLELAKALLHEPRLLLLDEPATGLDPGARRDVWEALHALRRDHGVTVVLTTHLMDEAEQCDRLAVLAAGRLVAADAPAALKATIGGDVVTVTPADPADAGALRDAIDARFGPWPADGAPTLHDGRVRLEHGDGPTLVSRIATDLPRRARSFTVGQPTLEDVFLHLTGHTLWSQPESAADAP